MAKQPARFDPESGAWVIEDGTPFQFLPEIPSESPPYEFMGPAGSDPESPDGHRHYLIGGEPAVVAQIVKWYEKAGHPVPAGYAQAAADHAAAVKAAAAPSA